MSEYIDSHETFQKLRELLYETANNNFMNQKFSDACIDIADNRLLTWFTLIPKSDVRENVRGEWLGEYEGENDGTHHCSVCGGWVVWDDINHAYTYNFCPWCGADMREGEKDE